MTVLFLPKTVSSFALVLLYCLCKSLQRSLFLMPSVLSESGCKGKEFFVYPPNFCGTFFEVFFEAQLRDSLLKSGCKGKELFSNYQIFWEVFFRKFFEDLRGKELSAWASLMRKAGKSLAAKGQLHQKSPATACQVSPLRFRKRVQKYSLFR